MEGRFPEGGQAEQKKFTHLGYASGTLLRSLKTRDLTDDAGGAALAWPFGTVLQDVGNNLVKGGMHHLPQVLADHPVRAVAL